MASNAWVLSPPQLCGLVACLDRLSQGLARSLWVHAESAGRICLDPNGSGPQWLLVAGSVEGGAVRGEESSQKKSLAGCSGMTAEMLAGVVSLIGGTVEVRFLVPPISCPGE